MAFSRETFTLSTESSGTGGTTQATSAFNLGSGRLVVVTISWAAADVQPSITDTAGNTYTALTRGRDTTNGQYTQIFYVLSSTANASNVVTATWSGGGATYRSLLVSPYTYSGTASFVAEPTPVVGGSSTTPATGSFTAGDLGIGCIGEFTGTTATAGSGWTEQADASAAGFHSFDRIDSPGGTITASCTLNTAAFWVANGASFADTISVTGTIAVTTANDTVAASGEGPPGLVVLMGQACL